MFPGMTVSPMIETFIPDVGLWDAELKGTLESL